MRDLVAAHGVEPELRIEAVEVHDPTTEVGVAEQVRHAGDVIRRNAHENRVGVIGGPELDRTDHVGRQMSMAEHRGLGRRRGAARVEQ